MPADPSSPNFDPNEDPTIANESDIPTPTPLGELDEPTDSELRENFIRLVKKLIVRILILAILGGGIYYGYKYLKQNNFELILPSLTKEETTPATETPANTTPEEISEEVPTSAENVVPEETAPIETDTSTANLNASVLNSADFQNTLARVGLTSATLTETPKFIDFLDLTPIVSAPIVKTVASKAEREMFTIYEAPLPSNVTFAAVRSVIEQQLLANNQKAEPALFGPESFYFLWGETATTVFPLGGSAIGVHYTLGDFPFAKIFIAELMR